MADPLFWSDDDANTPLSPDERDGLIPSYITLRHELNEAEQTNIGAGERWALANRRDVLDRTFLSRLHRHMFGDVWSWAGRYRTSERNIGIDPSHIIEHVQRAIDDARFWIEHQTFSPDEIAIRFSHRLVKIHPFPNGNGRLSRLVGDLLARQLGRSSFSWGRADLVSDAATRSAYIAALRAADENEYEPLLRFCRS